MAHLGDLLRGFHSDDAGAIAIDWVALTAGILLLGLMVVYAVFNGGVASLVSSVNSTLSETVTDIGSDPDAAGERTGNAVDQACITTGKFTVCMGPK